jgi:cytidylate kinase
MEKNNPLPILVTFDGEARSGKGTIVQATKDYLRDAEGHKVMLIDAGQVFRVLAVAAERVGVDLDNPAEVDAFLSDDKNAEDSVQLVKDVYHMSKEERDALLYTNEVGHNSARIGARGLSMTFKNSLLKKWLRDARIDGFDVVLLDGRTLDEVGTMLEREGLCEFKIGLYFICDPIIGAKRTLGFATKSYEELTQEEKASVDELVAQIGIRNESDAKRAVEPIVRPDVPVSVLPEIIPASGTDQRPMYLIDTSNDLTKQEMSDPVTKLVADSIR